MNYIKSILTLSLILLFHSESYCQGQRDSILVSVDYEQPEGDKFYLEYEFGQKYDPAKPTVIAMADGQQFWARPGRAARFQKDIFGKGFNVVVVFNRATNQALQNYLWDDDEINWKQAYRVFNASQWIEDVESVRKKICPTKKIHLYGRSGGGLLLLQYLEKYNQHVDKAFCQTAILPDLEPKLGFRHDKFWEEITRYKPELGKKLIEAIETKHFNRDDITLALQRQNFFVSADSINQHRELLINTLYEKDSESFDSLKQKYQVEAVKNMSATGPGISSAVRQYEFYMLEGFYDMSREPKHAIRPNMDALLYYAKPLIYEYEQGNIDKPASDFSVFHKMETQVFLFAGRWDHTVDYRGQYFLTGLIPNSILFLANDNHVFSSIYDTDNYGRIVRHALSYDKSDQEMKDLFDSTEYLRWNEWMTR